MVFLRVRAGNVDRALKELRKEPTVRQAEPILGRYDIAVSGAFRGLEELQRFTQEVESKEYCEGCVAYPGIEEWKKERPEERRLMALTFIRTSDAQRAKEELRRIPEVQSVLTTTGPFNVVASIAVDDVAKLQETVLHQIQTIQGVRRTETLPGARAGHR